MSITTTTALCAQVRNYLKTNQIKWGQFSKLVLGVSQSRLSTLLKKNKPWDSLSIRELAYYNRMQEWMDTRATYGNNPYFRVKKSKDKKDRKERVKKKAGTKKKHRSLIVDTKENREILGELETINAIQNILEESESGHQLECEDMVVVQKEEAENNVVVAMEEVYLDLSQVMKEENVCVEIYDQVNVEETEEKILEEGDLYQLLQSNAALKDPETYSDPAILRVPTDSDGVWVYEEVQTVII